MPNKFESALVAALQSGDAATLDRVVRAVPLAVASSEPLPDYDWQTWYMYGRENMN